MPPVTRAKRAIEEAPKPKPARFSAAHWYLTASLGQMRASRSSISSELRPRLISTKKTDTPSRPRPTTTNPITAPPEKATRRAALRPCLSAAWAVRALASVATTMPHQPAKAERRAPAMKQPATRMPSVRSTRVEERVNMMIRIHATQVTKAVRYLYSVIKKDLEPAAMESESFCIFSLPRSFCLREYVRAIDMTSASPEPARARETILPAFMLHGKVS
mmetsp:Transcript_32780/g.71469  ORF Transcript_32780/g.71469 Transcript_32780/m.71469 type:complete len:219 (-) Transcript_32780:120-776(-)